MNEQPQEPLESLIHRELRQLPPRRAPRTLAPRVRAALEARARLPWWRRAWTGWPLGMQVFSGVLALLLVGFLGYATVMIWESSFTASLAARVASAFDFSGPGWDLALSLGNAALVAARSFGQLGLMIAGSAVLCLYLSCFGLGTAYYRVMVRPR
ncbi:MAG TPA: hypothetical protein VHH73_02060 [Verrucomicrobiae bacterium]|nr:hypothetical protein [Verrucomicrobiae bacterium]